MTDTPLSAAALDAGVAQGVLTAGQAARLRALDVELDGAAPLPDRAAARPRDPENLRFVGGFADVFVAIGILLFLGALSSFFGTGGFQRPSLAGALISLVPLAASWGLAEYFTRKRRMALPSIVLLIAFVQFTALSAAQIFLVLSGVDPDVTRPGEPFFALTAGLSAFVTVAAAALHYWRFRVPITVAAGAAALVGLAFATVATLSPGFLEANLRWLGLAAGAAVFALAMRFDLKDRLRVTRNTDIAFWLHLLAAPLVVRGVLPLDQDSLFFPNALPDQPWLILVVFALLSAVSVVIDRRALLVSGLIFAGAAAFAVLDSTPFDAGAQLGLTVLVLGAFILLLSAGWQPLRRALLKPLPASFTERLPRLA